MKAQSRKLLEYLCLFLSKTIVWQYERRAIFHYYILKSVYRLSPSLILDSLQFFSSISLLLSLRRPALHCSCSSTVQRITAPVLRLPANHCACARWLSVTTACACPSPVQPSPTFPPPPFFAALAAQQAPQHMAQQRIGQVIGQQIKQISPVSALQQQLWFLAFSRCSAFIPTAAMMASGSRERPPSIGGCCCCGGAAMTRVGCEMGTRLWAVGCGTTDVS